MKAVILAAGKSTRTYPLTLTRPKPLLPFLDGTILDYTLDLLKELRFEEAILVVNYKKEMIEKKYGHEYKGIKITYIHQDEPKGTGHAILATKDCFNKEEFLVLMGDDIYAKETIEEVMKKNPSLAVREVKSPKLYGIYEVEEKDGELIAKTIEEKPDEPKSNLANLGCYFFETSFFEHLERLKPSPRGELEVTDAIREYLKGKDIRVVKAEPYWLPVGHPWDLLTATERLIGQKSIIDDSAEIKGKVDCCAAIGKNVKIGEGTIVENSLIFGDVEIGKDCRIKNSIIGYGVKIGDNLQTMDTADEILSQVNGSIVKVNRKRYGLTIGDNATIGNDITTAPGVKIWPNAKVTNDANKDILE